MLTTKRRGCITLGADTTPSSLVDFSTLMYCTREMYMLIVIVHLYAVPIKMAMKQ